MKATCLGGAWGGRPFDIRMEVRYLPHDMPAHDIATIRLNRPDRNNPLAFESCADTAWGLMRNCMGD